MAYNNLSECTLTADERMAERDRILLMFEGHKISVFEHMNDNERAFLKKIEFSPFVTVKQLFWLRDIKDRYL